MTAVGATVASTRELAALARELGAGAITGALAGILVGGIGSRVAMRIAGAMSDPSLIGTTTGGGNVVGAITLPGTLALVIFGGLLPGVVGGVIYAAVRPWLLPLGRWGGLALGLAVLAAAGASVLEEFNIEFRRFGSPQLNVALFALLFPLYGVTQALLFGALKRRVRWTPPWEFAGYAGVLAAIFFAGSFAADPISDFLDGYLRDPRPLAPLYWLVAALALRAVHAKAAISYAVLLVPSALGLPATIHAITFLARP